MCLLFQGKIKGIYLPNIENEDLTNVIESMGKNKSDVIEYVYKKENKILGFSRLSNGWILAVSAVTADILTPIKRLKNNIKVSVVFLLIITGIIGLFISKSITAPINRLRDMAALISQGQHNIELDLNSTNEIGELSKSIHIMTKKLLTSQEELKESEEKFRALADTSPFAIYMSEGIEQKAMYINPTFTEFFGYTINEVPTVDHWWPLAYPDFNYRKQVSDRWQEKVALAIETESEIEPMEVVVTCKDGSKKDISWGFITIGKQNWAFGLNLTERKQAEKEKEIIIEKLQNSLKEINSLRGILPICAECKNIRNDEGYYEQIESYIQKHSEATFSHGLCPKCSDELYGDKDWYVEMKKKKGSNLS
jgi:PAS domain S-box-containing protein